MHMELLLLIRYAEHHVNITSCQLDFSSDKGCQPCGKMEARNSLEDDLDFPYYRQALTG